MLFSARPPNAQEYEPWYHEKIDQLFSPLEHLLGPVYGEQKKELRLATRSLFSVVHGICFLQETGRVPLINKQSHESDMTDYLIKSFIHGIYAKKT